MQEEGEEELPLEAALHCVLAAFRALQGPGRELQTDEGAFVGALYRRLPDLLRPESGDASGGRKTASCVALVYDCLDAALGKRRELSTARVAAVIKRLLSVSLQMTQVGEGGAGRVWYLASGASGRAGVRMKMARLREMQTAVSRVAHLGVDTTIALLMGQERPSLRCYDAYAYAF